MAAKRLRNEADDRDSDTSAGDKRLRSLHCFAEAVRSVLVANEFKHFSIVLEPMIRKVVHEEVERGLFQGVRSLQRSPQMQVKDAESTTLMLVFEKQLSLPIFTASKIEDEEGNPLRVMLVDTSHGGRSLVALPSPVRVEIVVVDGDFPGDRGKWTKEEFEKNIVKERTGKRPLITGDVNFTLREGSATIGEINFTDNSSWIRSRHFRIGAKVAGGSSGGFRIMEAITEAFTVKDHRGESYKKHYPPARSDEVWRLERIGKDGVFHKRLQAENINTVEDFLTLSFAEPDRLRSILGPNMSEKMWEATLAHARTCDMESSLYLQQRDRRVLPFDPVCEVRRLLINGHPQPLHSLGSPTPAYMRHLVQEPHRHWRDPHEANGVVGRAAPQQQDAMVAQIGYDSSPSSSDTFLPSRQETLIIPTYHAGGFGGETIHGNLELEFGPGWNPHQNNQGFFDDC